MPSMHSMSYNRSALVQNRPQYALTYRLAGISIFNCGGSSTPSTIGRFEFVVYPWLSMLRSYTLCDSSYVLVKLDT